MAKRFSTLQREAEQAGYQLTQSGDRYYATWEGISLDDDDAERLTADMESVIEISADDSPYVLAEEPDDKGRAIITFDGQQFADLSIAEALRQAKEARTAKEKPAPAKRNFNRKPKAETVAAVDNAVEPWVDPPAPNGADTPVAATNDQAIQALLHVLGELHEVIGRAMGTIKDSAAMPPSDTSKKPRISRGR